MKPFKAWAIVKNDDIVLWHRLGSEISPLLILDTLREAKLATLAGYTIEQVEIRAVERLKPLPPTKAKNHYCR